MDIFISYRRIGPRLKELGKTQKELAQKLKIRDSAVTGMLKGERKIQLDEASKIREFLEWDKVKVAGYVGAGATVTFGGEPGDLGEDAPAPENWTPDMVAVIVRGNSLGEMFDQWLVFYDDVRRPVTPDLIGQLCIVGLHDDRVLIKKLARSRTKGRFHLLSNTEQPILDARVDWAARVKGMAPR